MEKKEINFLYATYESFNTNKIIIKNHWNKPPCFLCRFMLSSVKSDNSFTDSLHLTLLVKKYILKEAY